MTDSINKLQMMKGKRVVSTWSGGLDTTTLIVYLLSKLKCKVLPVFINRGQKNYAFEKKSIKHYNEILSKKFEGLEDTIELKCMIPASFIKEKYSLCGDDIYVLRNSDILNQAIRIAVCENIPFVTAGSHFDENKDDNSVDFYKIKNKEIKIGVPKKVSVIAPFLELKWGKSDIVKYANSENIELSNSRSCWKTSQNHCGGCLTCVQRKNAYKKANVKDFTDYIDNL